MGHSNLYNNAVVLFVALGSFTYGFNSSIVASFTGLPSFNDYFDFTEKVTYAQNMLGAMNALYAAGGLVGCGIVGWMADKIGRARSIQIICACCITASILTTASVNVGMLLAGRTLQGISSGMIDVIVPLYQSEVSPVKIRGRMVGSHACLLVCGYAGASWVGLGCYFLGNPRIQWRLCIALQMVAPILLAIGSPWIPESPRWLIYNGRQEESRVILHKLHSRPDDPSNIVAGEEFAQIVLQVALDRANEMRFFELWKNPSTRKRLILGFFVIFAAQSSGVLVINNYQIVLYKGLGVDAWHALLLLGVYTSWAAFMNLVNAALLDCFGRIKLMCIGMTGAACAVAVETALVAKFGGTDNTVGNAFGILFLFIFITFFAGGMDASSYVYLAELYPTWMRAQGVAFSVMGLFSGTLIYAGAASDAFNRIGWKYYLVFVTVPLVCVAIIWYYLPETNGLSLEEIGKLFGDEVALDLGQMTPEAREDYDKSLSEGKFITNTDSPAEKVDVEKRGKFENP